MPEEWLESDDEDSESPPEGQTREAGGQVAGGLLAGVAGMQMARKQGLSWSC